MSREVCRHFNLIDRSCDECNTARQPGISIDPSVAIGYMELEKQLALRDRQIEMLREALESISKNSCCGQCQEAKKWAEEALSQFKQMRGDGE